MFEPETLENTVNDEKTEPRTFSAVESVFAWLCLAAGYAFCRVCPVTDNSLGGLLFTLALLISVTVVLYIKGYKFTTLPCIVASSAVVVAISLIFTSNGFIHFFAYTYSLATVGYFIFAITGNNTEDGFSSLILIDYFKALFIMPFVSFVSVFRALFSGRKSNFNVVFKILVGIFVAVIPTLVVIVLLSYDSSFMKLLKNIFDVGFKDVFSHIGSFILGIPIGMYIFGLFLSSVDRRLCDVATSDNCHSVASNLSIAPAVTVVSAVLPILSVYVLFFISQWKYYVSGFVGVLPDSISYAEYAREGFFQLCIVSVINLVMLIAVSVLMRRKQQKTTLLQRVISIVISLFTLVLIATAVAKMVMYINCYGLTPKRVYATWFMAVIALVFIVVVIKQFVNKMQAVAVCCAVCVISFATLSFANTDSIIAEYNVDRYIDGTLNEIDVDSLTELGDSSLPALVRLANHLDKQNGSHIENYLDEDLRYIFSEDSYLEYCSPFYRRVVLAIDELVSRHDLSLFSFTIPSAKAQLAVDNLKSN